MVTPINILGNAELAEGFPAETLQFASEQPFGPEGQEVLCRQGSKGKVLLPGKADVLGTLLYLNSHLWVYVYNIIVVLCMLHCLKVLE